MLAVMDNESLRNNDQLARKQFTPVNNTHIFVDKFGRILFVPLTSGKATTLVQNKGMNCHCRVVQDVPAACGESGASGQWISSTQ
jgi:hypothetical protein